MSVVLIQEDAAGAAAAGALGSAGGAAPPSASAAAAVPAPSPSSSAVPCCRAPATMRADAISFWTRAYVASSSAAESTRTTPMEAAPKMGLMTAGKPTWSPAAPTWDGSEMRKWRGEGRPAASRVDRVADLSRAVSTAAGGLPGRPSASARRATRGTAISQKVHTPSRSPTARRTACRAARARSKTVSASPKSRGQRPRPCRRRPGPAPTSPGRRGRRSGRRARARARR